MSLSRRATTSSGSRAADLRRHGLAMSRATTLLHLAARSTWSGCALTTPRVVLARLTRERGIGPWSVGVIALEGLGRYDHGLVGDLGLVKLLSSLRGESVEADETAALLAPYAEWQGLAGLFLMLGWSRGLIPGADRELGRATRLRTTRSRRLLARLALCRERERTTDRGARGGQDRRGPDRRAALVRLARRG